MEIVDLTQPINADTPTNATVPSFHLGRVKRHESSGLESDYMVTTTHIGTHVDSPYHFVEDGRDIGEIGLDELIRPTKKADLRDASTPGEEIPLSVVKDALPEALEAGEYLCVNTGWSEQADADEYRTNNPYLADAVSEFIVESEARGIVTDTPIDSVDGHQNHSTMCGNDKVIVENVVNLSELPSTFTTYVAPIFLEAGDAAPARVFVVLD